MLFPKNAKIELLASKDPTAPHLAHAYLDVRQEKPMLVATDGQGIVAIPVRLDPRDVAGAVSAEALKAARKAVGKRAGLASLTVSSAQEIPGGATLPRPSLGDLHYPDWRRLVQETLGYGHGRTKVSFNVDLLKRIVNAIGCESGVVTLTFDREKEGGGIDHTAPILVSGADAAKGAIGVMMPCRLQAVGGAQ